MTTLVRRQVSRDDVLVARPRLLIHFPDGASVMHELAGKGRPAIGEEILGGWIVDRATSTEIWVVEEDDFVGHSAPQHPERPEVSNDTLLEILDPGRRTS